jgi:predicted DNA-binding ribbon-helix-helix protein
MENLDVTHIQKSVQIDYTLWQKVRKIAFDREMTIKSLIEDILTGKTAPILMGDI